jgi:hypothetical protein
MIKRTLKVMFAFRPPEYDSIRWQGVFEFIAKQHSIDPATAKGRKYIKELDLHKVKYSAFSDEDLLKFFELVRYRATVIVR